MPASFPPPLSIGAVGNIPKRRNRLCTMYEAVLAAQSALGQISTFLYVFPIPSDAYAARIVLGNNVATAWNVTSACIAPSDSVSDYVNPTVAGNTTAGAAGWTNLTFVGNGVDSENIVLAGATRTATVPAAGGADPMTGSTIVPTYFYSDFVPIAPITPSPTIRFLFVRVAIPNEAYTRNLWQPGSTSSGPNAWTGNAALNSGFDASIRSGWMLDLATTPGIFSEGSTSPTQTGVICSLEYMSLVPGINLLTMGDSQIEGATTSGGGCSNFVTLSGTALSTPQLPICVKAGSWGGQPSDTWWPMFEKILSTTPPSVAVFQSVSGNDTPGAGYFRGLARTLAAAKKVQDCGGVAIICTPFPRPAWGITSWKMIRAEVLKLGASSSNFLLFDTCVGTGSKTSGAYDCSFLSGMSTDGLHPNDAAHAVMAANFMPMLRQIIGN